uniref:Uncharacterized protein n=1 Tax=Eutreptiella gymnastica TaxID=73025 RepID=A0A7S1IG66_9EUGL
MGLGVESGLRLHLQLAAIQLLLAGDRRPAGMSAPLPMRHTRVQDWQVSVGIGWPTPIGMMCPPPPPNPPLGCIGATPRAGRRVGDGRRRSALRCPGHPN